MENGWLGQVSSTADEQKLSMRTARAPGLQRRPAGESVGLPHRYTHALAPATTFSQEPRAPAAAAQHRSLPVRWGKKSLSRKHACDPPKRIFSPPQRPLTVEDKGVTYAPAL